MQLTSLNRSQRARRCLHDAHDKNEKGEGDGIKNFQRPTEDLRHRCYRLPGRRREYEPASIDSFANRANASARAFRNRESLVGRILERSKSRPDRFPRHDSFKTFIVKHLHRLRTSGTETDISMAMANEIRSYAELPQLIRVSLRIQNPEWTEPSGDSPLCDSYEARLAELLRLGGRGKTKRPECSSHLSRH